MRIPSLQRKFGGVAVVFLLVILLSWIGQQVHVRFVGQGIEMRQQDAIATARKLVESEFANTQKAMQFVAREANRLASSHAWPLESIPSASLIQELGSIRLPEQWSVSIYDMEMRLIAWQGESLPLGGTALTSYVDWKILRDEDWRTALVLWEPLIVGDAMVGRIRVTQNLFSRAPVHNSVLEDYDIVDTWRRRARLDIEVAYGDAQGEYVLESLDGKSLGTYTVTPPSEAELMMATAAFYDNLMALGGTLLVLWFLWGIWRWYQAKLKLSRLAVFAAALGLGRFIWLYLEVPARYQTGKAPLSPLFDPVHLASTLGGGLMRTTGDLLITALCGFILGVAVFRYAHACSNFSTDQRGMAWIRLGIGALAGLGLASALQAVISASVLDSTLSYTGRSVLVPSSIELVVYASLILFALGCILIVSATFSAGFKMGAGRIRLGVLGIVTVGMIAVFDQFQWSPWLLSLSLIVICLYIAAWATKADLYLWLAARRAVPAALAVCLLLYPVYYDALSQRKRDRVAYAVSTFDQAGSPEVSLAVREVVEEALRTPQIHEKISSGEDLTKDAENLLRGSLLSSLGAYDASITFLSATGEEIHTSGSAALSSEVTQELLTGLSTGIELQASNYTFVEPQSTGAARYQYAGLAVIGEGWILVRAQPHIVPEEANTPLLRILSASGYLDLYEDLSLASYQNGRLIRTFGDRFSKYQLDSEIASDLRQNPSLWRRGNTRESSRYLTYYLHRDRYIVAARMAVDGAFDHLYYLLRLVAGGLILCIPFCTFGYMMQWRAGLLPRARLRYQDKVMNAFLLLGIIAVIPVGIAGYNVVTEENEKALQSWLRQHLERIESTLAPEGWIGGNSVTALERMDIDSLSARVGLDLNLYQGTRLVATSRRQLIDDRIVDERLPAEALRAIYGESERFMFVDHRLGDFEYTAGYRAILDSNGDPAYILSVPTLPEAERIEEERARTLAYLFGAMLGLGILVMFTGSVLARALARPIARLQQGLEEAAQGKFERVLPVESRDEVGALVNTFNTMQGQLAESRQKLARQQRQLAWREMARQVAHEIKNPLTPMKLSVQHLQRSFGGKDPARFKKQFHRTTETLIAQIDSLAHIANEFSSFAQLPRRKVVTFDLREVIREAHALMQAEASVVMELNLADHPLMVRGDPNELRRTYINLIKNALEAVHDQDQRRIAVTGRLEEDQIITEVTDNGSGIPPEVQDRIFEPSFSTKTRGAGLGLAIAKQAVELSGGEVHFATTQGQGTTMQITLPLCSEEA